jgi:hypothetical protein
MTGADPLWQLSPASKRCSRCGVWKQAADFPPDRKPRSGLSSWCRACHNAAVRAWRERNADVAPSGAANRHSTGPVGRCTVDIGIGGTLERRGRGKPRRFASRLARTS